jgi:hypothetical protein
LERTHAPSAAVPGGRALLHLQGGLSHPTEVAVGLNMCIFYCLMFSYTGYIYRLAGTNDMWCLNKEVLLSFVKKGTMLILSIDEER